MKVLLCRACGALTSTILFACIASAPGGSASHQYFRFTPTKLRNNAAANSVQLSEMQLFLGLNQITGAIATNPRGNNPGGESPADAIDGSVSTKWLDFNKGALVLNFGSIVTIDGYRWATANDAEPRDPIRFTLEGSIDNLNWTLLDDRSSSDFAVPLARNTFLSTLDLNQVANTPDIVFTISAGGVTSSGSVGIPSGSQVTLTWEVSDSTSQTLDFGAGPMQVAASGSTNRTLTATRSYTLVASNASGSDSATVTALVGGSVIPPVINELVADQANGGASYDDEDGNASDWIELHNPNSFAIGVGGYHLTDDVLLPKRWMIPVGTSIAADGFLVIFASGKDRAVVGSELHTNFSLGRAGEYLGLFAPDGSTTVDELVPNYPIQTSGVSYGRVPPALGDLFNFFIAPTPGAENDTPAGAPGEIVSFVTPAKTFSGSLDVTLSAVSPTAQIRYTTNGSLPSRGSALYGGPIRLNNSALVRARVYDVGFAPGEVKAEAYIELDNAVASRTSDLPVVILENFGRGSVPDGSTLQASYFTLHEPDTTSGRTDLTALPTKANRIGIKRRGSSTLNDPKGNYRVEFWQDDSEIDKEVNLLGMSKHDEWILFAPYRFDRSLIRIPFIHNLSNAIGAYAPRGKMCEVYLNTGGGTVTASDYQGVYVLQERISRDPDRVDIDRLDESDISKPDVSGGYLLSIDRRDSGDSGFRSALGHPEDPAIAGPQPWFTFVYPKEQNILPQQKTYIRSYIDGLESALYGPDFTDPDSGYEAWLDCDASIDHHILVTFSKDPDALRLSTYLFKPRHGKLGFGPIWDFDRTMGCDSDGRSSNPLGWDPPNETAQFFLYDYWGRLFQDPNFWQKWIDRWQSLRDGEFSEVALRTRVDSLAAQVAESAPRNTAKWRGSVPPNGGSLTNLGGWPGEIDHLKEWLTRRADWIDTQFTPRPFLQASGQVDAGDSITALPVDGVLYYTTDGSDPRRPGGAINPNATAISGGGTISRTLVSEASTAIEVLKPSSASPGPSAWTAAGFDSAGWQTGNFAVGYDYAGVDIDVEGGNGNPTSVYIRAPFTVNDPANFTGMTLRVKYDDGFVAYLNGTRIDSANAPAGTPAWNGAATANHDDSQAVNFIEYNVSGDLNLLVPGTNLLAIHALNTGNENSTNTGSTSSDMLLSAELIAVEPAGGDTGITVNSTTSVTARALDGSDWSGPLVGTYVVGEPASSTNLVASEIMYHPVDASPEETAAGFTVASDFEFLEVQNVSGQTIDLTGVVISEAFDFEFSRSAFPSLAPGAVALVVRNRAAFEGRYGGGLPIAGQWGDPGAPGGGQKLSNGGEGITITAVDGVAIQSFAYDDSAAWPPLADGHGRSLVLNAPFNSPDHSLAASWRDSIAVFGTPGSGFVDAWDEWRAHYFTPAELAKTTISGDMADPEGDGLANFLEMAFSSDPKNASPEALPAARIETITTGVAVAGEYLTVTFTRRNGIQGLMVEPEFSDDLISWNRDGILLNSIDHGDGSETVTYRAAAPDSRRRFVRVMAVK